METLAQWIGTKWIRHPYRVEGDYLKPVSGGKAEEYDPFAEWERRGIPLYRQIRELREDRNDSIAAFASTHGLLGLFQHHLVESRLPVAGVADIHAAFDYVLRLPHDPDRPQPTAIVEQGHGGYKEVALTGYCRRYFPDVGFGDGLLELAFITRPLGVFEWLCEPVDDFIANIRTVRHVAMLVADVAESRLPVGSRDEKGRWHPSEQTSDLYNLIEANIRRVHYGLGRPDESGVWRREWHFPSLLSAIYMMLFLDLTGGKLRACLNCRSPFVPTKRATQKYCCHSCLNTAKLRTFRGKGGASTTENRGDL